jgi:hypothetical protein
MSSTNESMRGRPADIPVEDWRNMSSDQRDVIRATRNPTQVSGSSSDDGGGHTCGIVQKEGREMMKRASHKWITILVPFVVLASLDFGMSIHAADEVRRPADELLAIGKAGPKAIKLALRTDKPAEHVFKPGETIDLYVRPSETAHVVAVYLSQKGDTIVLYPNSYTPDTPLSPDKDTALFSASGPVKIKVSDSMKEGRIIFFVSSEPFQLAPLSVPEGKPCIHISASSQGEFQILRQKIQTMAQDAGFNRVVLALKGNGASALSLNLMGLPTAVSSEKPEPVTGVQGVKPARIGE